MKTEYVQAFIASLESGMSIDAALSGLKAALTKHKHLKLFPSVLSEAVRTLESEKGTAAVVSVARSADTEILKAKIEAVLAGLGVPSGTQATQVVDETLIGGFVATFNYKEHDASYKKSLQSLYESIVK